MLPRWLAFGARRNLMDALAALEAERPSLSLEHFRQYFSRRLPLLHHTVRDVDAEAALLAATAALFAEERAELFGALALTDRAREPMLAAARRWGDFLRSALSGSLDELFMTDPQPPPRLVRWTSRVRLFAVERNLASVRPDIVRVLHEKLDLAGEAVSVRARGVLVKSLASLSVGDRTAAIEAARGVPDDAPAVYRMVRWVAQGQFEQAAALAEQIAVEERSAVASVTAAFAVGADGATLRRALDAVGPHASAPARLALSVSLASALAREGNPSAAWDVLRFEQPRAGTEPLFALATGILAIANRQGEQALDAIRKLSRQDPTGMALRLLALALLDRSAELVREIEGAPTLPGELTSSVRCSVLGALARGGVAPSVERTPPWLAPTDDDAPEVLCAWALVSLHQRRFEQSVEAFDRALRASPGLPVGDAPESARLHLARQRLAQGRVAEAEQLSSSVRSARLARTATGLRALAIVLRRAQQAGVRLDAPSLRELVQGLRAQHPSDASEVELLAVAEGELLRAELRAELRAGRWQSARALAEASSRLDPCADGVFLQTAYALLSGVMTPVLAYSTLAPWAAESPEHAGIQVLLGELRRGLEGPDAALGALERALATSPENPLIEEALASLYREAFRSLDAKRIAVAAARRAGAEVSADLAGALASALSLEFAPTVTGSRPNGSPVARAEPGALLPGDKLGDRVHVLLGRAARVAGRSPALDEAAQALRRAVVMEDVEAARRAEFEAIAQLSKVGGSRGVREEVT